MVCGQKYAWFVLRSAKTWIENAHVLTKSTRFECFVVRPTMQINVFQVQSSEWLVCSFCTTFLALVRITDDMAIKKKPAGGQKWVRNEKNVPFVDDSTTGRYCTLISTKQGYQLSAQMFETLQPARWLHFEFQTQDVRSGILAWSKRTIKSSQTETLTNVCSLSNGRRPHRRL